jgi:DtxR family Mn-dependent transcriptional regulator
MNSPSIEDYLKAIYKAEELGEVSSQDIAQRVGVSPPAVSKMLRKLQSLKLVRLSPKTGIHLTPFGKTTALTTIRRHRLIELYLVRELGYTWDEVHDEAERLEHHISPLFERRIAERLGHPEFDPHGDPIPTSEGVMPIVKERVLASFESPATLVITRLLDRDPELLRYAAKLKLVLGMKIELLGREPFGGPFIVLRDGEKLLVAPEAAEQIFAAPV